MAIGIGLRRPLTENIARCLGNDPNPTRRNGITQGDSVKFKGKLMAFDAFLIATVCLYSTGHWIGGTVLAVVSFLELMAYGYAKKEGLA